MTLHLDWFSRTAANPDAEPNEKGTEIADGEVYNETASTEKQFPKAYPAIDGKDCLRDCDKCTIRQLRSFKIEEAEAIYGRVRPGVMHVVVATGKTDLVPDFKNENESLMEAFEKSNMDQKNGILILSASNNLLKFSDSPEAESASTATSVLILPAFTIIDNVRPASVHDLIQSIISTGPTTTSRLRNNPQIISQVLRSRPCPHKAVILLCSQRTCEARSGQALALLRREFQRHLQPLGLYREVDDERPGGVGIYSISYVGGHKYSANVIIYHHGDWAGEEVDEAWRGIWMARVRPEDCEGIVRFAVVQGKVGDPRREVRAGVDGVLGRVSW